MPMTVTESAGTTAYASPFMGPIDHPVHVKVDVSTLLIDGVLGAQVDSNGYIKPGTLLKLVANVGVPLAGTAAEFVYAAVIEATKIVAVNPTNTSLGADTSDPFVACTTRGVINRDVWEDNMGRAMHANEVTALAAAGSHFSLTVT